MLEITTMTCVAAPEATNLGAFATRSVAGRVSDAAATTYGSRRGLWSGGATSDVEPPEILRTWRLGTLNVTVAVGPVFLPDNAIFQMLLQWPGPSGTPVAYPAGVKGARR